MNVAAATAATGETSPVPAGRTVALETELETVTEEVLSLDPVLMPKG